MEIIKINEFEKMIDIDEQQKNLILEIANYIIDKNASYGDAAKKFGFSKKTVCVKMKDKLPYISKIKSEQVREIVKQNTSFSVENDEILKERVLFECELFMRGYTLEQLAYLVNNSYSSTQRDLSERLPKISEEKGQLLKTRLQYNQGKMYRKIEN